MLKKGINYGTIQMFSILYIVVWTISPFMEIDMIYRLLGVAFAGLWAFILILRQKPLLIETNTIFALVFLVAVVGITYIETGKASGIIKQISYFMMIICFIICQYYKNQWEELKMIVPVVLVLFIIFNFRTFYALLEDPALARQLVRDDANMYKYLRQGIGGYSLIYPQVCVFPALLQWTICALKNNKIYFAIGALNIVSFLLVIFNAGYSIAIFSVAVGTFLLLLYKGNSGVKAFFVALVLFVIIMYLILYVEEFRNWILNTFKSNAIHKKINDLIATAESGDASGSIAARLTRYLSSIRKIFIYPVIGALWRDAGGGHSAVLDTFAKYGLWGGAIYCFMIYFVPNSYKRKNKERIIQRTCNATLVAIMIVSILDSISYAFSAMLLLVLPLYLEYIIEWTGNKNENSLDSKSNT